MNKFQSLLANIHVTFEAIEEMQQAERLSFAQVYQAYLYTTAMWNTTHPNNPALILTNITN
jgi:precorrin-6B methylase 2